MGGKTAIASAFDGLAVRDVKERAVRLYKRACSAKGGGVMSALDQFHVSDDYTVEGKREYMATLIREPFCAFVEYVEARTVVIFEGTPDEYTRKLPAGYQPSFNVSENVDISPSNGTPMSTPEHAAQAAISLSQLHLRAVARSYRPFGEGADEMSEVTT